VAAEAVVQDSVGWGTGDAEDLAYEETCREQLEKGGQAIASERFVERGILKSQDLIDRRAGAIRRGRAGERSSDSRRIRWAAGPIDSSVGRAGCWARPVFGTQQLRA